MSKNTQIETPSNGFTALIGQIRNGDLVNELSEEITKAIAAMRAAGGKAASVTLKLGIKPIGKGDVSSVFIVPEVTTKLPKPDKSAAIFFTTEDNQLQRNDPNQREFELRTVNGGKQEEPLKVAANQ